MSKTIEGVPEYLTREQYISLFAACGFTPQDVVEVRLAADGVHALVFARDETGRRVVENRPRDNGKFNGFGYWKHRVFIPVRDAGDERTTRITPVKP